MNRKKQKAKSKKVVGLRMFLIAMVVFLGMSVFSVPSALATVMCECVITVQLSGEEPVAREPVLLPGESPSAVNDGPCKSLYDQALTEGGASIENASHEVTSCRELEVESKVAPPPERTPEEFDYVNPLGTVDLNEVLGRIIRTVLGFVGALFLAMFVYGGTQWMLAGGDAKKVESGRKTLINAVIGMVVIAISYSVISIIFETASVIRGG